MFREHLMVDCEKHFIYMKMRHKQHIVINVNISHRFFLDDFVKLIRTSAKVLSHFAMWHQLSQTLVTYYILLDHN